MIEVLESISRWIVPFMLLTILTLGLWKGVPVYETFVEGAKEGFHTSVRLIPYLVAMFMAIAIFQQSQAMEHLVGLVRPLSSVVHIPEEILPLAFIRPLSGSGALGLLANMLQTHGPDSFLGRLASTVQGSTETTLYVVTVYFGAVGIRRVRHALYAGLAGDLAGFLAAVYIVYRFFG